MATFLPTTPEGSIGSGAPGGYVPPTGPAFFVPPAPMVPVPTKPPNPSWVPFTGTTAVEYLAPLGSPFAPGGQIIPSGAPAPAGCGGGHCPLAQPPAGGTVTITRTDGGMPVLLGAPSGVPSWLTKVYGGIPLWVWLLIAFLALVALRK